MVDQRSGKGVGEQVAAFGVDALAAPDVLVEHAVVDEAGQGDLHRYRGCKSMSPKGVRIACPS
jgi:hypothetical protein